MSQRRSRWLLASSVALGALGYLIGLVGAWTFMFFYLFLPVALALLAASAGCALLALRDAEGLPAALALSWWAALCAMVADPGARLVHEALCGAGFHPEPVATLAGFALALWLPPFAVGLSLRGRAGRTAALGCVVLAPVVLALTWWQTDRAGMLMAAATELPAPALALLLADGRPADVEPVRSASWSMPHPDRPLRGAVWASRADAVRLLLERGADATYEEHVHLSLLADALKRGDRDIALLLLEAGAGRSPAAMEHTAQRGDAASIAWLLDHGAEPGAAMLVAVRAGHREVVDLLLERGAPVSGFAEAVVRGDEALLDRLLAASPPEERAVGAELALGSVGAADDPATRLRLARKLLAAGASPDACGGAALGSAVSAEDPALVELLLDAGAQPYLGHAMSGAIAHGRMEMLRLLTARGGPLPQPVDRTWLFHAASGSSVEVLDVLLDAHAPVEVPGEAHPPLCVALATHDGSEEVVARLIEAGAEVERSCYGRSVRVWLSEKGPAFEALAPP